MIDIALVVCAQWENKSHYVALNHTAAYADQIKVSN